MGSSASDPENELEQSLKRAVEDSVLWPQFVFRVYAVIGDPSAPVCGALVRSEARVSFQVRPWERGGTLWLPIFSSPNRLRSAVGSASFCGALNARDFLESARGSHVVLNPNVPFGKELLPTEIAALLDGSIFQPMHEWKATEDTRFLNMEPAELPANLVEGLIRLFRKNRYVRAAYLVQIMTEPNGTPNPLIGIDVESDWDQIIGDAGLVASRLVGRGEIVDFMRVDDSPLWHEVRRTRQPFYKRSFLRKFLP